MKIGLKKQQLRIIVETTLEFKISVKTSAFVIALKEGMIGKYVALGILKTVKSSL